MQNTINRGEKGKVEIKVTIPKAEFLPSYEKVVAEFAKDAKIAGFRPGKAPAAVVEQHFGTSRILNETASFLISKNLSEILQKEKLVPLDSPKIAIDSLSQGAPFSFTATFFEKPKVKVGNWKEIKIKKIKAKEITDKDVDESIKNIFEAWKKSSSAKASVGQADQNQSGELSSDEGQAAEEGKGKFIYDAHGNKIFIEGTKGSKDSKGTKGSKDKIDDNFAKAIGARDLAHLKEIVKKDLETIIADGVESKFEDELFEKILEIGQVEVPDILVEDELNRILVRLNSELERQRRTLENYLEEQKITIEELKTKWRPQAQKNVKISLILDEVGREEKVKAEVEEVEVALKNVNQTNLSEEQKADLRRYLTVSIFQAKTLDFVKKTVTA